MVSSSHVYHVILLEDENKSIALTAYVTPEEIIIGMPYLEQSSRLTREFNSCRFLRVRFQIYPSEIGSKRFKKNQKSRLQKHSKIEDKRAIYQTVLDRGIRIGALTFQFAFSTTSKS